MRQLFTIVLSIFLVSAGAITADADGCNECHSKNPKMVKMHATLEFKDCFKCHGFGRIKPKEQLMEQRQTDQLCIGCHGNQ